MPEWVDFKEAKKMVTMSQLFAHYNISLRGVGKNQLRGPCPLPQHTSRESKESFNVNLERNVWSCKSQSCLAGRNGREGGNVLDFVRWMEQCELKDAAAKIVEWFGSKQTSDAVPAPVANVKQQTSEATNTSQPIVNKPLSFELKGITYHPYLESRGISRETAENFGVGFFPGKGSMAGRIVVPIRGAEGALLAYAGRSIDNAEPKYKLPPGFQKHLVLFNRNTVQGNLCVLVEGFFGALYLAQFGFPAVAMMGCTLSPEQEDLLPLHVILLMDGDEAGKKATAELLPRLARKRFIKAVGLTDDQQPDSLSGEQLQTLLSRA